MALSNDLISQFAKTVNGKKNTDSESTVYGTTVKYGNKMYVQLDGSDRLTPISTTAETEEGERVTVRIKNHTATVTGNMSSPAARVATVEKLSDDIITATKVIATEGIFKYLTAEKATIANLIAEKATIENLVANDANIANLIANKATIDLLIANQATIESLIADEATIGELIANEATITDLIAKKADIESLDATYADIEFANITEAAIEKILADTGLVTDLTIKEGKITGKLSAVEIDGDVIKVNNLIAKSLKLEGENGLYYGLNVSALGKIEAKELDEELQGALQKGIHGSNIVAKSITADHISASDITSFAATIGGIKITKTGEMYSGVKESVNNTTQGFYLDRDGQMALGDMSRFIKYYKDTDGDYKLEIAADTLRFGADKKTVTESIKIGARNLIRNSGNLIFQEYYFSGPFLATYKDGNITISSGASAFDEGDGHVVVRTSANVTYDGNGNVTLV